MNTYSACSAYIGKFDIFLISFNKTKAGYWTGTNNIVKLNIDVPCNFLYTGIESSLDKSIAGVDAPNRDALSKLVKFRNITLSVGSDKEMRSLFKKVSILRQADKIEFTPTRRGKSYDAMTSMSEVVSGSMTEVCAAFWRCIDNCI